MMCFYIYQQGAFVMTSKPTEVRLQKVSTINSTINQRQPHFGPLV